MLRQLLAACLLFLGIASVALAEAPKRVLLLGQKRDHPPKTHEYFSGLHVLAKCLEGVPGLDISVINVDGTWPEGPGMIAQADAVVLFLGEGAKWQQSDTKRKKALDAFLARGGGFVCIHWAIGAKDAQYIPEFLKALGGMHGGPDRKYVICRTDVSLASAGHPILSGVEGLSLDDEFYYRLKFAASGKVTPLLSARIEGKPETCAWAFERPDGGRSFGFVGMHNHSNWRLTACRRMIAQAVLWSLKLPIPQGGLVVDVVEEDYQIRPDPPVGSVTKYGPRQTSEVLKTSEVLGRQDWPQLKFDSRRSGDTTDRALAVPLGLLAVIPLSDAVFTAPVIADGKAFVVDGSGVVWAIDTRDFRVVWRFATPGGPANCNNGSSPAVAGRYLHVGTMAGGYYVLDIATGKVVKEISCGEPIFSAPVVARDRVYFATLGSKVYALEPDGRSAWTWDYVVERLKFQGDRWSGADWRRLKGQATWREQFCCTRDLALHEKKLVLPAGGALVWLEDAGDRAVDRGIYLGQRESPATLGLSLDASGTVYRQWTQRDNNGAVETLRWKDGKPERGVLPGTETSYNLPGLLSFSSVSLRGGDAYRSRPEEGLGLCLHRTGQPAQRLSGPAAVAAPILVKDAAVYGDLQGALHVVPLSGGKPWSFKTPFGKAISAPVAVSEGRVYFGADDGYFYVLGPGGKALPPAKDLQLHRIRSPMPATAADSPDWFTSFGNWANTNATRQAIRPPLKLRWVRRYEGTVKHFSVCGGGRMYTHTAEGQIFAVEQETGRLLWRRYFPGVHISYTSPLYYEGRLLVPQAGLKDCRLRCLDAATGKLIWEAPFSGSPSWNRQSPPIVYKDLVIYQFSSGAYRPENWLFEHQSTFGFPANQKPLLRAWDLRTGKEVWTRDFSQYGAGGDDAGSCLMGDTVYYSCYFGKKPVAGVTAAVDPVSGQVKWVSTKHSLHAGCTISARDGRLYLGGYNPVDGDKNVVWCLDARDGSLVWKSEPVLGAIHVVTVMDKALFVHAQYRNGYLLDKQSGRILTTLTQGYRCTRFTCCEPYLIGSNFDLFDLSQSPQFVSSGPQLDVLMCVGAVASNGRLFLTTNGSGLQACMSGAGK